MRSTETQTLDLMTRITASCGCSIDCLQLEHVHYALPPARMRNSLPTPRSLITRRLPLVNLPLYLLLFLLSPRPSHLSSLLSPVPVFLDRPFESDPVSFKYTFCLFQQSVAPVVFIRHSERWHVRGSALYFRGIKYQEVFSPYDTSKQVNKQCILKVNF